MTRRNSDISRPLAHETLGEKLQFWALVSWSVSLPR